MIFVTGGTGLVGSHLLYELVQHNEEIIAAKRPKSNIEQVKKTFSLYSNNSEKLFSKIKWVDIDLFDIHSIIDILEENCKVYHCAAWVSFNPKERIKLIQHNIEITANIVNACLEANIYKLCHVSSIASIGNALNGEPTTEDCKWKSSKHNSAYSISKYESEMEVWRGINEGLNAVIVNPSVILGPAPGNWQNGSAAIFDRIYKGMKFYTEGITGYVSVYDVVQAMIQLMDSEVHSQHFILNSADLSFKELFTTIANDFGKPAPSHNAGKIILKLAVTGEKIRSFITNSAPQITKESIRSAISKTYYSSKKIEECLSFQFDDINKRISEICKYYTNDKKTD